MKIVVIGGTGLIGSRLTRELAEAGHEAVAASPETGVNTITGDGLAGVLTGASVVVDVSNSPSWEDAAVLSFFETSTRNLLSQETAAGVRHHIALSVVGTQLLSESGYFRAKIAQENLIQKSSIPYCVVHATQFFEFLKGLADISMRDDKVHLPSVLFQPMAADDVAGELARIAVGPPANGIIEIGGPEQFRVDDLVRRRLASLHDSREVIADPEARYSGAVLGESTLLPGADARLGKTLFADWLNSPASQPLTPRSQEPAPREKATDTKSAGEFRVSDVPPGSAILAGDAAVFNVGGRLCATQAKCTHRGGPLSEGKLDGPTVTCPWHGAQFNVCTGAVLRGPATEPIKTFRVTVHGDMGQIEPASLEAVRIVAGKA